MRIRSPSSTTCTGASKWRARAVSPPTASSMRCLFRKSRDTSASGARSPGRPDVAARRPLIWRALWSGRRRSRSPLQQAHSGSDRVVGKPWRRRRRTNVKTARASRADKTPRTCGVMESLSIKPVCGQFVAQHILVRHRHLHATKPPNDSTTSAVSGGALRVGAA